MLSTEMNSVSDNEQRNTSLVITNVRSLSGTHKIRLAPLTILVGENSSGKSTVLAMLNMLLSARFPFSPSVGRKSFNVGGFSSIVTRSRLYPHGVGEFSLGLHEGEQGTEGFSEIVASYKGLNDRTTWSKLRLSNRHGAADLKAQGDDVVGEVRLAGDPERVLPFKAPASLASMPPFASMLAAMLLRGSQDSSSAADMKCAIRLFSGFPFLGRVGHAVAPIRTKPKRIYDGLSDDFSPEGDHVPPFLASVLTVPELGEALHTHLKSFGKVSGLFNGVQVKALDKTPGAPFQLLAKMTGVTATLPDVGYGVSQVLPVLAECLTIPDDGVLMVQQPEVHLHPRAQAALGSFFVEILKRRGKARLVVETHSDYLLNRVRREIARGHIGPRQVALHFFEKKKAYTQIHEITLDRLGNVCNAPESYRSFFLQENFALLTRSER